MGIHIVRGMRIVIKERKGWSTGFLGLLLTPGIELYLSRALKLDIFVEIQYLGEFDFGGGGDESLILMIPSVGIRF